MKPGTKDPKSPIADNTRFVAFALAIAAFLAYVSTVQNDFIRDYDDSSYVVDNPIVLQGITPRGIIYAFTETCAANWHPLTMLSHMLDVQIYGIAAFGHHLTNVFLHSANVALLFLFLTRATRNVWPSAIAALLFAIHPVHVENVAHIAQRKDLLSTFFMLLALLAYTTAVQANRRRSMHVAALWLSLGLLSKPMLVTIPFVMLLLDYWPLQRVKASDLLQQKTMLPLLWEKASFFVIIAVFSATTVWAQRHEGAIGGIDRFPISLRVENALLAYTGYLRILVWPTGLSAYYPYPDAIPLWQWLSAAAALAAISLAAASQWKQRPYILVGWLWFIGTLVPVIGLVQVGGQSMADRYAYVPFIGLYIGVAWTIYEVALSKHVSRRALSAAVAVPMAALAILTVVNTRHWRDAETLWTHAITVTDNNEKAHANLATLYGKANILDKALIHAKEALRIAPVFLQYSTLGNIYFRMNNFQEAENAYRAALARTPNDPVTIKNLGKLLLERNRPQDAESLFESVSPRTSDSEFAIARIYLEHRMFLEAERHLRRAAEIDPKRQDILYSLGVALEGQDRLKEAFESYTNALELGPAVPEIQRAVERLKTKI
jgi:Flp pilus assembly protein TadD